VFVEKASNVPRFDELSAVSCGAVAPSGFPYMRIWAEADGSALGRTAEWPVRHCKSPAWFSAQPLAFSLDDRRERTLHVEMWNGTTLLCKKSQNMLGIKIHEQLCWTLDPEPSAPPSQNDCTVVLQIMDANVCIGPRTIFFVRHGQSVWNKAQSNLDVYEMYKRADHPLSSFGRDQAIGLASELASATDKSAAQLGSPDMVYVSPLTRAIQTAVIGLGDALVKSGNTTMVFMPNAREKKNFGGADSRPECTGSDVIQRASDELGQLFAGHPQREQLKKTLSQLRFDTQEVEDRWWQHGLAESDDALQARLNEFMAQLLYSPHRTIVVVGHSHFFRACFKRFLAPHGSDVASGLAEDLHKHLLPNCGVARLMLDAVRNPEQPILSVELLFGAKLDKKRACCTAPSTGDEIILDAIPEPKA
jgi:broad specificity phosphatase PhoE